MCELKVHVVEAQGVLGSFWEKNQYTYCRPLNNTSLNCMSLPIHGFFSINIQLALHIPGFHMYIFNQLYIKTVFSI